MAHTFLELVSQPTSIPPQPLPMGTINCIVERIHSMDEGGSIYKWTGSSHEILEELAALDILQQRGIQCHLQCSPTNLIPLLCGI